MLSLLLLQAREAETSLSDAFYKILQHLQQYSITTEEEAHAIRLYNRICQHAMDLIDGVNKSKSRNKRDNSNKSKNVNRIEAAKVVAPLEANPIHIKGLTKSNNEIDDSNKSNNKKPRIQIAKSVDPPLAAIEVVDIPLDIKIEPNEPLHSDNEKNPFVEVDNLDSLILKTEPTTTLIESELAIGKPPRDKQVKDYEPLTYEYAPGYRYKSMLIYVQSHKQLYRRKKSDPIQRFICNVKGCTAKVNMVGNVLRQSPSYTGHQHPDQEERYLTNKFRERVIAEMLQNQSDPFPKIIDKCLKIDPVGGAKTDLAKLKSVFKRYRNRKKD